MCLDVEETAAAAASVALPDVKALQGQSQFIDLMGVFEQACVEQLDEELDRAAGALLSDLKQLTQANMEDEVEFFIRALDADLIVPSDFYL
jgi:hypothetical protein